MRLRRLDRSDEEPLGVTAPVTRLLPAPACELPLEGLYLSHALHRLSHPARPFVYSNFVASLDGRISETGPGGRKRVPAAIANPRDWRLYLELLAQADALLTSTRHLRAVAAGRQTELLALPEQYPELADWRKQNGLRPNPLWVVISRELTLPARRLRERHGEPVLVLTCKDASGERASELEAAGIEVEYVNAGAQVDAWAAMRVLARRQVRSLYTIAGPRLLHTLLGASVLDRLYLTHSLQLLGGTVFDTLVEGPAFESPRAVRLRELYLDADQLFACYEPDGFGSVEGTEHPSR